MKATWLCQEFTIVQVQEFELNLTTAINSVVGRVAYGYKCYNKKNSKADREKCIVIGLELKVLNC